MITAGRRRSATQCRGRSLGSKPNAVIPGEASPSCTSGGRKVLRGACRRVLCTNNSRDVAGMETLRLRSMPVSRAARLQICRRVRAAIEMGCNPIGGNSPSQVRVLPSTQNNRVGQSDNDRRNRGACPNSCTRPEKTPQQGSRLAAVSGRENKVIGCAAMQTKPGRVGPNYARPEIERGQL